MFVQLFTLTKVSFKSVQKELSIRLLNSNNCVMTIFICDVDVHIKRDTNIFSEGDIITQILKKK